MSKVKFFHCSSPTPPSRLAYSATQDPLPPVPPGSFTSSSCLFSTYTLLRGKQPILLFFLISKTIMVWDTEKLSLVLRALNTTPNTSSSQLTENHSTVLCKYFYLSSDHKLLENGARVLKPHTRPILPFCELKESSINLKVSWSSYLKMLYWSYCICHSFLAEY